MGELKGTLKNGDCQGSHLVIYIKFLDELRGTGGHYNKFYGCLYAEDSSQNAEDSSQNAEEQSRKSYYETSARR